MKHQGISTKGQQNSKNNHDACEYYLAYNAVAFPLIKTEQKEKIQTGVAGTVATWMPIYIVALVNKIRYLLIEMKWPSFVKNDCQQIPYVEVKKYYHEHHVGSSLILMEKHKDESIGLIRKKKHIGNKLKEIQATL